MWNFKRDIFRIAGETACVIPNMSGYSFAITDEVCTSCTPQTRYNLEQYTKLMVRSYSSFNPDGTLLYLTRHNGGLAGGGVDKIIAYSLSTPWDVSTISTTNFLPSTKNFSGGTSPGPYSQIATPNFESISLQVNGETRIAGHCFSPDGLNLFVSGLETGLIQRYTVATAWDITNITLHSSTTEYVPTLGVAISGIKFSTDGLTMILLGDKTARYTLSSPWKITVGTLQYTSTGNYSDIDFQNNGLYLFTYDSNSSLVRKTLSSAYNITGVTATQTLNLLGIPLGGSSPRIHFKDGYKGYISTYSAFVGNTISAFELSCSFDISGPLI